MYLFSHVYVSPYLLNYITSLYWKLSENYKHGCRNNQPICTNKGRNESDELSSNNLRFFQNNLGLVFHTTYSCIFHSCYLLLLFSLPHFPPLQFWPYRIFHSRIFSRPQTPASYLGRWILRSHMQYAIEIGSNCNFQVSRGSVVTQLRWDGKPCNKYLFYFNRSKRARRPLTLQYRAQINSIHGYWHKLLLNVRYKQMSM